MRSQILAHFKIGNSELPGALNMAGAETRLEIYSSSPFRIKPEINCIEGVSDAGKRISAIYCVGHENTGFRSYFGKTMHFAEFHPNYIVIGPRHIDPEQKSIAKLSFTFSDANAIFFDLAAFGHILGEHRISFGQAREILRDVRKLPRRNRRGGRLDLYYKWDRGPIVEVPCAFGTLSAWNATTETATSPYGIKIDNQVRIDLKFESPVNLDKALEALYGVMPLFEILSQSRQNIEQIELTHFDAVDELPLELHMPNETHAKVGRTHPGDLLVSGTFQAEEFGIICTNWVNSLPARRAARQRFIQGFRQRHNYSIDRLVGSANVFDLLPKEDFQPISVDAKVEELITSLSRQVMCAAQNSNHIEKYRERFLHQLALVRGRNLRDKVLQRYHTLPSILTDKLVNMDSIIEYSIKARNFFVHGAETTRLPAKAIYEHASFFTDTLEFVFATSELIRCGWDADRWAAEEYSWGHFKQYVRSFTENQLRLQVSLNNSLK